MANVFRVIKSRRMRLEGMKPVVGEKRTQTFVEIAFKKEASRKT
jgi:hypothetical protein